MLLMIPIGIITITMIAYLVTYLDEGMLSRIPAKIAGIPAGLL